MLYLSDIKADYKNNTDLIIKPLKNIYIIYLETLIDQDKINNYILKFTTLNTIPKDITTLIPSPNVKDIKKYEELKTYLSNGFTIILNNSQTIAIETKGNLTRSIDPPNTEPTIYGPKDSLTENIQTNLGLIKRRIKSSNLKNINIEIGRYTKTNVSVLFIDTIAESQLYNTIINLLHTLDIDGINDIGEIKKYLIKNNSSFFPIIRMTERPDVISKSLLEGKVIIIMDNSPFALITPSFLADFINPISDDYTKNVNVNFLKILRFFSFFLTIITPAFYISIITYNQETVPTLLLLNFQTQRSGVPFPATIECLITLITCEILRESDIRFPSSYGSAISILGALVLGEAAVSAGIVSPIMIIIVAITFISSLIFTDLEMMNAIRYWRFIFLFICSFYGLYGLFIGFILLMIHLTSNESFFKPYFYPLSPFDKSYINQTILSAKNNKRGKLLSKNKYKGEL